MKIKAITLIKTKEEARQYAIDWQKYTMSYKLSWGELAVSTAYFETIGKKFNLIREFKLNGII